MSKKSNKERMEFLFTFFDKKEGYEEKEVNGFWLIKSLDGNYNRWIVSIYPQDSYWRYKKIHRAREEPDLGWIV